MRFFVYFGFLLWLAATLLFRFWGDELINPEKPFIWLLFILVVPSILLILNRVFRNRETSPENRPKAALLIAMPGMILDLGSIGFHQFVFPSLPEPYLHLFFVWLLWAYSLILLGGLICSRQIYKVS